VGPYIYCGQSFVGNINAALLYPPTWLMFCKANLGRSSLSYQSLEDLTLAHVWWHSSSATSGCRNKKLAELASILGAAVFAYSGYMLNQLQHLDSWQVMPGCRLVFGASIRRSRRSAGSPWEAHGGFDVVPSSRLSTHGFVFAVCM